MRGSSSQPTATWQGCKKENAFRSDLYFRLEAHKIDIPPLRERKGDIPLLVDSFAEEAALQLKKEISEPPVTIHSLLESYPFPGNVRELRNMIFDAVTVATGPQLDGAYFQERLKKSEAAASVPRMQGYFSKAEISRWPALPSLKDAEQLLVEEALRRASGNQTIAARFLGLTRSALNKRLTRAREESEME